MRDFFSYKGGIGFHLFNKTYIITIALFIVAIILLYKNKEKLKKWKYKDKMRYVFAGILFTNMTVYYISLVLNGIYDWKTCLPLHLCFITGYFFMYTMVTGNKKLFKLVYLFTFVGPLPAILVPDTTQGLSLFELGPDRYIYYQYIISHHFLIISSLYTLWVLEYKIELKDFIPAFIYGNILIAGVTVFNIIFGTNYIMVFSLPEVLLKYFPFFGKFPPILCLELAAIIVIMIAYIPVELIKKEKNNKNDRLVENI